jgi:hypothetical protein
MTPLARIPQKAVAFEHMEGAERGWGFQHTGPNHEFRVIDKSPHRASPSFTLLHTELQRVRNDSRQMLHRDTPSHFASTYRTQPAWMHFRRAISPLTNALWTCQSRGGGIGLGESGPRGYKTLYSLRPPAQRSVIFSNHQIAPPVSLQNNATRHFRGLAGFSILSRCVPVGIHGFSRKAQLRNDVFEA